MAEQSLNPYSTPMAEPRTTPPAGGKSSRSLVRELFIALFLVAFVVTAYWTVGQMKFVYFDDPGYITDNLNVLHGLPLCKDFATFKTSVYWAFTAFEQSNWHPLTWLSHMLDVQCYQLWPGGHHITNIILHSLNTLLVFWLFLRLTSKPWRSAAVAAMFAVHPMHVESVVWVAERKDVLSTFIGLLTMHVYVTYSRKARFDGPTILFSASLAACIGMLGWLWYHECFWFQQQELWFSQLRIPASADVSERFQQQCQWFQQHGFSVSPNAHDWREQQSLWLEQHRLNGLALAYDGIGLAGRGLLCFAAALILSLGGVGWYAYATGRSALLKYCGVMLGFVLVGLGMLAGSWWLREFGGERVQHWTNGFGGTMLVVGIAGAVFAAYRRRYDIAFQSAIFAASVAVLMGLLSWIQLLPPEPPASPAWYDNPLQTVVERMWCGEFVVALFVIFGSLAAEAILSRRSNVGLFCVVLVLYTLGLLAKPMLVTLPFLMLLIDFWPLGRLDETGEPQEEEEKPVAATAAKSLRRRARRNQRLPAAAVPRSMPSTAPTMSSYLQVIRRGLLLVVEKLPLFALAGISSMVTPIAQSHGGSMASTSELSIGFRLQNAMQSYAGYMGRMIWPGKMMSLHLLLTDPFGRPYVPREMVILSVVVFLLVTAVAVAGFVYGRRYLTFGWLWYVGTLVPVIGFVQVGEQSMADRYTYIPYIGLFVAIVWAVGDWLESSAWLRRMAVPVAVMAVVVILCSWISWSNYQIQTWSNVQTHLLHALDVEPDNWNMLNNYGVWLWKESQKQDAQRVECLLAGDTAEAAQCEQRSTEFKTEAKKQWNHGVTVRPTATDIHSNLGYAFSEQAEQEARRGDAAASEKSLDQAEAHLQKAVELKPISSRPHNNLGRVLLRRKKEDQAIYEFQQSIRLDPTLLEAHLNLAQVYEMQKKPDLVAEEYRAILSYYSPSVVEPEALSNFCQALVGLSRVACAQQKYSEALGYLQNALAIQPRNIAVRQALATTLILQGQRRAAEEQLWILLSLSPDRGGMAEMLGAYFDKMEKPQPDHCNFVWSFMSWAFATAPDASIRNGKAAIILAQRVCQRTNGKDPWALDALAAANSELGQFGPAVQAAQAAIVQANMQGNKSLAAAISQRLASYQQGQPYRCKIDGSDRPLGTN